MERIDRLHTESPFYGSRKLAVELSTPEAPGEPQAGATADACSWVWKPCIAGRNAPWPRVVTRSIRTC